MQIPRFARNDTVVSLFPGAAGGMGATKLWSLAGARPVQRWALALVGVSEIVCFSQPIVSYHPQLG